MGVMRRIALLIGALTVCLCLLSAGCPGSVAADYFWPQSSGGGSGTPGGSAGQVQINNGGSFGGVGIGAGLSTSNGLTTTEGHYNPLDYGAIGNGSSHAIGTAYGASLSALAGYTNGLGQTPYSWVTNSLYGLTFTLTVSVPQGSAGPTLNFLPATPNVSGINGWSSTIAPFNGLPASMQNYLTSGMTAIGANAAGQTCLPTSTTVSSVPTQTQVTSSNPTAWAGTTVYAAGAHVSNGGNYYVAATGGTSAASGGPTGTGQGIADGSNGLTWNYTLESAQSIPTGSIVLAASTASACPAGATITFALSNAQVQALQADFLGIQSAAAAAHAAGGGRVVIPAGSFVVNRPVWNPGTTNTSTITGGVDFQGDSQTPTYLVWQTDLGAGTCAIGESNRGPGSYGDARIDNLHLVGPGTQNTAGAFVAGMDGFCMGAKFVGSRLYAYGFHGQSILEDHGHISDSNFNGNFYGLYFGQNGDTIGNWRLDTVLANGEAWAGVADAWNNSLSEITITHSDMGGLSPYEFYREALPTGQTQPFTFFSGGTLLDVFGEGLGDGFIYDDSSASQVNGVTFINVVPTLNGNAAYQIPGRIVPAVIYEPGQYTQNISVNTDFSNNAGNFQYVSKGIVGGGTVQANDFGWIENEILNAPANKPIIYGGGTVLFNRFAIDRATGEFRVAEAAMTSGNIVAYGQNAYDGGAAAMAVGGVPLGIVVQTMASGSPVPVVTRGLAQANKVTGTAITQGQPVVASSVTPTSITAATAGTTTPVIGTLANGASALTTDTTAYVDVRPDAGIAVSAGSANTATTAAALSATPTGCTGGQFATGIAANGNAACGTPSGSGTITGVTPSGAAASGGGTTGAVTVSVLGVPSGYYNVKDPAYGAKGNGIVNTACTTTASAATLSCSGYTFTSADTGKYVAVVGAVAVVAGSNPAGTLSATIISESGGVATMSANATNSIAGTATATFGTNDTAAIQAAWTAAAASTNGHGTVYLPDGIYIINGAVAISSKVSMTGNGAGKSIIKWISTSDKTVADLVGLSGSSTNPYTDNQFTNFEIDDEAATLATWNVASKAIYIQWMLRPVFEHLYLHGSPASCLGADYLPYGNVSNNIIVNCGRDGVVGTNAGSSGIGIGTSSTWNEGTIVEGNVVIMPTTAYGYYGIFFEDQSSTTLSSTDYDRIVGNWVVLNAASQRGIGSEGTSNTIIMANHVLGSSASSQRGISIGYGTGSLTNPSGNYVHAIGNYVDNTDLGIVVLATSTSEVVPNDLLFADNWVSGSLRYGLWLDTGSTQLDTIKVAENTFTLNDAAGIYVSGTGGIKNLELYNNTIKNNALTTSTADLKAGISITGPVNKLEMVGNNIFDDNTGTQLYGMILDTAAAVVTNANIQANDLRGNGTGAISITNSASIGGWIAGNPGYNPVGASAIAVTSSPQTITAGNTPESICWTGGTVTAATLAGSSVYSGSSGCTPPAMPGQAVVLTYTGTPTITAFVQ